MAGLLRTDVKRFFDPDLMRVLPGVPVRGTLALDAQTVVDAVVESGWTALRCEGARGRGCG
ncbi:hypothetical protein [Streptomyces sp. NBC_01465]|uniref:hypothetical protein n=1 Tax=Streptomyces sp. NBC_01465 TaxID=2903878 RepID=UPI002E32298D|nr:hypothetical protein [Streptomyces sp. NBC_01465]